MGMSFSRPYGTGIGCPFSPSDKSLGYFRASLQDEFEQS
jgi:hypothetical protein